MDEPGAAKSASHTASIMLVAQVLRTGVKPGRDLFADQQPPNPLCSFVIDIPSHELAGFLQLCRTAGAQHSYIEDIDLSSILGLPDVDSFDSDSESEDS